MVICFAYNKQNQKVVEGQAAWRSHKFFNNSQHVKISLITLKVSAVCTVHHTLILQSFTRPNWGLSLKKAVHKQKEKMP